MHRTAKRSIRQIDKHCRSTVHLALTLAASFLDKSLEVSVTNDGTIYKSHSFNLCGRNSGMSKGPVGNRVVLEA